MAFYPPNGYPTQPGFNASPFGFDLTQYATPTVGTSNDEQLNELTSDYAKQHGPWASWPITLKERLKQAWLLLPDNIRARIRKDIASWRPGIFLNSTQQCTHMPLVYKDLVSEGLRAEWMFMIRGHAVKDIVRVIQQLSSGPITKLQKDTVKAFEQSRSQNPDNWKLGHEDNAKRDRMVLTNYMTIFDRALFFGSMNRRTVIRSAILPPGRLGHTITNMIEVLIETKKADPKQRKYRLSRYLGTLLHEMSHAFLLSFQCRGQTCSNMADGLQVPGYSGHWEAWGDIYETIYYNCRRLFPGIDLDSEQVFKSDLEYSYALELCSSRREVSTAKCKEWEISEQSVRQHVQKHRR